MNQAGSVALIAALAFAAYGVIAGALGGALRSLRVTRSAERATLAFFVMITVAVAVLEVLILSDNFNNAYVASHSNRDLPFYYKIAVLWAGQEGSLLFWTFLLSIYGGLAVLLNHRKNRQLMPYVVAIVMATGAFFTSVVFFVANPFGELTLTTAAGTQSLTLPDGNGLTPALQYNSMVIHPPMLYLGYVGFVVPFAFAMAALITRQLGDNWIRVTRRWTMVPWMFLGTGILMGAHWAYEVLGWGGYWGWDPVENASFMPWLTGTAFLHSVMMQEKKGMMKSWNVWLIFSTFLLTLLGTLLTRAGLVSSVHAFAQSSIGAWFVVFMGMVLAVCIFTTILQRSHLKSEHQVESLVSRESSFLFNNLVLLTACFVILWGTLFPILSEYVEGSKVTVGAPFYNAVAVPIGLFLLFLTGVGPLLPWRATSLKSIRRNFVLPVIALWVVVIVCLAVGVRPWKGSVFDQGNFYALVAFALAAAVLTAILSEFVRGAAVIAKQSGRNLLAATWLLTRRNTRRYGGYIIHIGVVIIVVGLAGSAFNRSVENEMALHDKISIGPYTLEQIGATQDSNLNFNSEYALLDVYKGGKKQFQMAPEKRVYLASEQPQTMVAIHSTPSWDLYVVYEGTNPDTGQPIIKAFLNPLVGWIWAGLVVLVFGTLVALVPSQKPAAQKGGQP